MRREKTGDKCCRFLHSQRKANFILAISSAACEREFDDCFDKFAINVQRRNSGPFTMRVLEDSVVPF